MEYLGTAYAGFQRQPGKVTVQATLEKAIGEVTQENVAVVGSGRTDAGAHALQQIVAFSTSSRLSNEVLRRALNARLPRDIAVTEATEMPADFHPRYDASSRLYRYLIWNRPVRSPFWEGRAAHVAPALDEQAMSTAASFLVGHHDFGAFVPVNHAGSRTRTMYRAACRREGELVVVELEASGFLRQMVRAIAGTLIRVGLGQVDIAEFQRIVRSADRTQAAQTASARGLYLAGVRYVDEITAVSEGRDTGCPVWQSARPRDSKENI